MMYNARLTDKAAKVRKIALNDDDHLAKKEYERVTTDMPDPSRGLAYNAWNMYVIPEEKRNLKHRGRHS